MYVSFFFLRKIAPFIHLFLTHSFSDIHAIRILDDGNSHSLPAILYLVPVPYKH